MLLANEKYCLGLEIHDKDFAEASSINENEDFGSQNCKNFISRYESVKKYRPLEINFDNLRVSFDKDVTGDKK